MASSSDFKDYVLQNLREISKDCNELSHILWSVRKMFGEYCIYAHSNYFDLALDSVILLNSSLQEIEANKEIHNSPCYCEMKPLLHHHKVELPFHHCNAKPPPCHCERSVAIYNSTIQTQHRFVMSYEMKRPRNDEAIQTLESKSNHNANAINADCFTMSTDDKEIHSTKHNINKKAVFLICDNILFIKQYKILENLLCQHDKAPPFDGARDWYILDIDSKEIIKEALILAPPHIKPQKPKPQKIGRKTNR